MPRSLVPVFGAALLMACGLVAADSPISKGRLPGPRTEIGRLVRSSSAVAYYCGNVGYVDLGAELDAPVYYFSKTDGRVIARCGGYCEADPNGCVGNCPPKSWKCRGAILLANEDEAR